MRPPDAHPAGPWAPSWQWLSPVAPSSARFEGGIARAWPLRGSSTSWAAPEGAPIARLGQRTPSGGGSHRTQGSLQTGAGLSGQAVRDGPGRPKSRTGPRVPCHHTSSADRRGPRGLRRLPGALGPQPSGRTATWAGPPVLAVWTPAGPLDAGRLSGLHHRGRGVTSGVAGSHCPAVRRFNDTQPQCSGLEMMAAPQGQKRQAVRACCKTRTKGAATPWGGPLDPEQAQERPPELRGKPLSSVARLLWAASSRASCTAPRVSRCS